MYSVGDKVVHPMHGAGTIEEIKEIEIVGKKRQYYVLKFAIGNMVTNVPIENSEEIGIRPVIEKQEAKKKDAKDGKMGKSNAEFFFF